LPVDSTPRKSGGSPQKVPPLYWPAASGPRSGFSDEANFPTQRSSEEAAPRLPRPYVDAGRPCNPEAASREGPHTALGLTSAAATNGGR
jgi:hypothetical protein